MTKLTEYEQSVLEGKEGRLKQVAMENIVRYAEILGAQELCEVTKATVYCGKHTYLKAAGEGRFHEIFSRVQLARDEVIPFDVTCSNCQTQSCVSPCDDFEYQRLGQTKEFFEENMLYLKMAKEAGVIITGTCAPYLTGWLPVMGEHFVTVESSVTMIGNSLWGACCNSDGVEAAFWSAICGRTPKWGKHLPENRVGTHLFQIEAPIRTIFDWDLLGKAVGAKLPSGGVPVIDGRFTNVNFNKLRQFFTTLAIASNCEMCHIPGYTPEARSVEDAFKGQKPQGEFVITLQDIEDGYNKICSSGSGEISFVSLGCPHYDIQQIKMVAEYIKGKKVHPGVHFMLWTVYPIKQMAEVNGYAQIIEKAGGHIYTGSCPDAVATCLPEQKGFVFDSLKQAHTNKSRVDVPIYIGDMYRCIDAAVCGRWEDEYRWSK